MGSDVRDDILWLRSKANALGSADTKPAFAVVCFGANALIRGKNDERLRKDASSTAELCFEAVTDVVKSVECLKSTKIFVMSLPPRRDLGAKGLEAFRALSARYKGMAEGRGHQFVDVEQVLWPETAVSSQPAPAGQTAAALAPEDTWESDQVHLSTNAMMKIWRAVTAVVWAPRTTL